MPVGTPALSTLSEVCLKYLCLSNCAVCRNSDDAFDYIAGTGCAVFSDAKAACAAAEVDYEYEWPAPREKTWAHTYIAVGQIFANIFVIAIIYLNVRQPKRRLFPARSIVIYVFIVFIWNLLSNCEKIVVGFDAAKQTKSYGRFSLFLRMITISYLQSGTVYTTSIVYRVICRGESVRRLERQESRSYAVCHVWAFLTACVTVAGDAYDSGDSYWLNTPHVLIVYDFPWALCVPIVGYLTGSIMYSVTRASRNASTSSDSKKMREIALRFSGATAFFIVGVGLAVLMTITFDDKDVRKDYNSGVSPPSGAQMLFPILTPSIVLLLGYFPGMFSKKIDTVKVAPGGQDAEAGARELVATVAILGTACTGKSTILKQLRMHYVGGITRSRREQTRTTIHRNFVQALNYIHSEMKKNGDEGLDAMNVDGWDTIAAQKDAWATCEVTEAMLSTMAVVCSNEKVKQFVRDKMAGMMGNVDYFLLRSTVCLKKDYVPDDTAVLKTRFITAKLDMLDVPLPKGDGFVRFHDAPGQKERFKQWKMLQKFDDVDLVLFVGSLANFDRMVDLKTGDLEVLGEGGHGHESKGKVAAADRVNAITDSLRVFKDTISRRFPNADTICFMNMKDLLEIKMMRTPLEKHFPDYKGGMDPAAAQAFISDMYTSVAKDLGRDGVTVYPTCATDKNQMKLILDKLLAKIVVLRSSAAGL